MDPRAGRRICRGAGPFFSLRAAHLKDWFRHQLWLKRELADGLTRDAALSHLGIEPDGSAPPEPPPALAHLIDWIPLLIRADSRSPARMAADIRACFGLEARPVELLLLMELMDLWRDAQDKEIEG